MKRVLSLVLALVMVLGMIPMGFAAEATAGQTLKGYGIIEGYEDGSLGEDKNLNRAEMMVVLARMMGKGAEAEAFALPSTFTDLEGFGWAVPWIAYAEMNEWTAGVGANMYDPAGNVTAQQAAVFMLKALGYEADVDFNWTNAVEFATAKGLFAGVDTAATSPILRGDLFTMMITTLNTEVKDGSALLGIKLGYMEVKELAVVSVKALNLAQIEVKFNMAVDSDSATKASNYLLTDEDGDDLYDEELVDASFDLYDGDKTLIISLFDADGELVDGKIDQQQEAILEIDGVEAADDEENFIDDYVSDVFEFNDITIPKALKAEVIGNDTIKVTFSEPIKADVAKVDGYPAVNTDYFEVDGGDYIVKSAILVKNNTEVNVELYSELDEGKVSVEVGGMDDFAGFNVVKTTFEIDVVEDNDAPVVVGYKDAKRSEVTLIFNEDIEGLFDDDDFGDDYEKYFYHTNSTNTISVDGTVYGYEIDGNELTLKFDEYTLLPEGTAYVYVAADAVQDLWDNANDKIVTKVEVSVDNTAPTLVDLDVSLNDNDFVELKLTFSEDVDVTTASDEDNYLFIDEDNDEVYDFDVKSVVDDEVVIEFGDKEISGDFKLTVSDIEDLAGNEIVKVTKSFSIDDLVSPDMRDFKATIYDPKGKDQIVKIDFKEEMMSSGAYSVLDLGKYMINGENLEDLDEVPTIKLVDGGEAVEISIPNASDDGMDVDINDTIWVARVADAAGNKSLQLAWEINLDEQGTIAIDSAEVTAKNKIVVTFEDRLTTFNRDDIMIMAGGEEVGYSRVSTTVNSDNETVVTFTTTNDMNYDATYLTAGAITLVVEPSATKPSENYYGEQLKAYAAYAVEDAYAPAIAEFAGTEKQFVTDPSDDDYKVIIDYATSATTASAATITIEFTEKIDNLSLSRLTFSVEDAVVETISSLDGGENSNVVTIVIKPEAGEVFDTLDRLVVTQKFELEDESGNEFKSSTTLRSFIVDRRPVE